MRAFVLATVMIASLAATVSFAASEKLAGSQRIGLADGFIVTR